MRYDINTSCSCHEQSQRCHGHAMSARIVHRPSRSTLHGPIQTQRTYAFNLVSMTSSNSTIPHHGSPTPYRGLRNKTHKREILIKSTNIWYVLIKFPWSLKHCLDLCVPSVAVSSFPGQRVAVLQTMSVCPQDTLVRRFLRHEGST